MSIYRHGKYLLDMSQSKTRVCDDDVLIFQGSNETAIPLFVSLCDNKDVTAKFIKYLTNRK